MGCFFGCFRVKSSNANLVTPSQENVAPQSKNALSSLFLRDGIDESPRKGQGAQNQLPGELDVRELKDEAKFLKACGTLAETPVEIRNTSAKWEGISAQNEAEKRLKFNSWLPNESMEKLKLEKQSYESPMPVKICEEWVTGSGSLLDSSSSCMTDGLNTKRASSSPIQRSDQNIDTPVAMCNSEARSEISSVSTQTFATSVQCKNKYVHYVSDGSAFSLEGSSSECVSPHSKQSGSAGMQSATKPSPYPTSPKSTEEMQTPCTLVSAYSNDTGQVSTVRCQYANSVQDPAENPSWLKELKDENSDSNQLSKSLKLNDEDNLKSKPEMEDESSLSSWFKPVAVKQDHDNRRFSSISSEKVLRRKAPVDRPILGMVAAHWNDNETSHIPPKWWDGNGIPNSTNKYKEDQKVSWHATPFEERLEKALSEETSISQTKPMNRTPPFELNETEESDTALSHLQSSASLKSVVSV